MIDLFNKGQLLLIMWSGGVVFLKRMENIMKKKDEKQNDKLDRNDKIAKSKRYFAFFDTFFILPSPKFFS